MIGRREALVVGLALAGRPVSAQEPGRVYRLAHLGLTAQSERLTREQTLPVLARLGFVDGQNLVVDARAGPPERLPQLARELVGNRPDVVMAIGAQALHAAQAATREVPIVMFADDPVAAGVAASLSRPGGNVTGVANMVVDLQAKRLELLLETMPSVRRVGALLKRSSPTLAPLERELADATAKAGVGIAIARADTAAEFAAAIASLRAAGAEAVVIGPDPQFFAEIGRLAALADEARLALSCEWPAMARAGCLVGYGADQVALRGRLATYVARILRGGRPAEIPIEQPTRFELAVNLRTARALGISVPATLLARADEVIE